MAKARENNGRERENPAENDGYGFFPAQRERDFQYPAEVYQIGGEFSMRPICRGVIQIFATSRERKRRKRRRSTRETKAGGERHPEEMEQQWQSRSQKVARAV